MRDTRRFSVVLLAVSICGGSACGGGADRQSPVAPAPVPTPPPPPPPVIFTLDAPADHYQFSSRLQQLPVGRSLDVTVEPLLINEIPDNQFGHAVEVWLWPEEANIENFPEHGLALSIVWLRGSRWLLRSFRPVVLFTDIPGRPEIEMPLGQPRVIRVSRRQDSIIEFALEGAPLITVEDSGGIRHVLTRVVGTQARFTYVPFQPSGTSSTADRSSIPCGHLTATTCSLQGTSDRR